MSFRRRTYPEVLDNLLADLVGGVAGETHPFPPAEGATAPFRYSLEQPPVAQLVAVYGSRDGQPHKFRPGKDFRLLADAQTLEWPEGAELPDAGTLISVVYLPQGIQPVLTDLQTGSVARTLAESMGLEIARLYAQLEAVYRAGFIDTATGSALDKVVAVLGIRRVRGGRPAGEIRFTRTPGARGVITIPAGTRLLDEGGDVEYETTETVTMAEGQEAITAPARDLEQNDPVAADTLTTLAVPIAAIGGVTNPAPTAIDTREETDAELRTRAKQFLHGSERATLGALAEAIRRQGLTADIEETAPGTVTVTPHAETLAPELQQRVLRAIEDARPAGVQVTLAGVIPPKRLALELRLTTRSDLTEQDLRAAHRRVRGEIEGYFETLPAKDPARINRIVGLALASPEVEDIAIVAARFDGEPADLVDTAKGEIAVAGVPVVLGSLQIADPNLPSRLDVVVRFPEAEAPADRPAIEQSLGAALDYLNELNEAALPPAAPPAEQARRVLSLGKLLLATPLPIKPAGSLPDFDAGPADPATLPDVAAAVPYRVIYTITQDSGLARVLEADGDEYALVPFERLVLEQVSVVPEDGGG